MAIQSKSQLLELLAKGAQPKYLYFWGHEERGDAITKACFSQWYPAEFVVEGKVYPTAEHYMMAAKARLFGDAESEAAILTAMHPGAAKALGGAVRGFSEETWQAARFGIVVEGNTHKFLQHPKLMDFLTGTGERVLAEASPIDRIWGIGLAADDERCGNPAAWPGLNLLGFALIAVRELLRAGSEA